MDNNLKNLTLLNSKGKENKYIFDEKNYNSGDGMMTFTWGPTLWHSLHTISFNYPVNPSQDDMNNYMNFFNSLRFVLPCRYCRENYVENLEKLNFGIHIFKNRDTLSRWVYQLHEQVNTNLGKQSNLSYEDVRDRYEHFRSRCLKNGENNLNVEKGCTESLYGVKSKVLLRFVPKDVDTPTFKMSKASIIKKL